MTERCRSDRKGPGAHGPSAQMIGNQKLHDGLGEYVPARNGRRRQPRGKRVVPHAGPCRGLRGQAPNHRVARRCIAELVHISTAVDKWENQQVQSSSLCFPVLNADLSRSLGLELSLAGRPRPGLDLFASLALTEAEFRDFKDYPANVTGVPSDVSGNRLPYSSRFDIALGGQWIHPIENGLRLFGRVDFRYRSGFTFDPLNSLDETGYEPLNAPLAWWGKPGASHFGARTLPTPTIG